MKVSPAVLVVALLIGGCGEKSAKEEAGFRTDSADLSPPPPVAQDRPPTAADTKAAASNVALPQIAYTYDFTLELPAKAVVPLFERHRRACEAAGPARCQILGAETTSVGGTDTQATLTMRAEPDWLAGFRSRLSSDAANAKGEIVASKTESEDLGRAISDTGARLRALTTLQGRLEALLANRSGKLADLLETERELARVGGEIDATRSALADMRGRVTLPKATIRYRPDSLVVADAGATAGLGGQLYYAAKFSLFAMLSLFALLLPWLIVLVPLAWLLLRWRQTRRED